MGNRGTGTMEPMNRTEPDPEPLSHYGRLLAATRLLFAGSLVAVFGFLAVPAHAQSDLWRMDGFRTEIDVRPDGSLLVEETIKAEFLQPRHGIYRYVPYRGTTAEGGKYRLGIRLVSVTDGDGVPQQVKQTRPGDTIVWRIGDPDVTIGGDMTYVITYEVRGAILRLEDHDELYWNVAGFGWDVPLPVLRATVYYDEIAEEEVESRCYTGPVGSDAEDCDRLATSGSAAFVSKKAGDQMTIAIGWPKGHIGEEAFVTRLARFLAGNWPYALPFVAFVIYWAAWRKYGDDDTGYAVVPEYDPPAGLRPAQLKALMRQSSGTDTLAPTLIDLAVRGQLTIEETHEKRWYGTEKDYLLRRTGAPEDGLEGYEKVLMADIFGAGKEKKVSELKNSFYTHLPAYTKGVMDSVVAKGLFEATPNAVRVRWIFPGLLVLAGVMLVLTRIGSLFTAVSTGSLVVSAILSAVVIVAFGTYMPKWSKEGAAAHRHAQGFRLFISKVKKYRTEWEEKENIFETVLPYALAFGLGKRWAAAFEGLRQQPPSWYSGAAAGAWNPVAFESSLSSMTRSFASAAASTPSSRGGSGGGGFSGGGFGGGGGGSW